MGSQTVIFGGSFDPVHLGHLFLLHCVVSFTDVENIIIVPAKLSNFKQESAPKATDIQRLEMLKLALEDYSNLYKSDRKVNIILSDTELRRGNVSYTSDTLKEVKEKYGDSVGILIGDDHIKRLAEWHDFEYLKNNAEFIICTRYFNPEVFNAVPSGVRYTKIIPTENAPENASSVREDVERYSSYLSDKVRNYVLSNGLYRLKNIEQLKAALKNRVSEKRYIHSLGVASETEALLKLYNCENFEKNWKGFSAGEFCGIAHDFAREISNENLVKYCDDNNLYLDDYQRKNPVTAHGLVSAEIVRKLVGDYPKSWYNAISWHTMGHTDMDDLALSLFAADFIEPSRTFLTEEKRAYYKGQKSLKACEYAILMDILDHWKKKGYADAGETALALKAQLEAELGL